MTGAAAYVVLSTVNAYYAWRRRERALVNDLASVVQTCLMVFLVAAVAGSAPIVLCAAARRNRRRLGIGRAEPAGAADRRSFQQIFVVTDGKGSSEAGSVEVENPDRFRMATVRGGVAPATPARR